MLFKATSGERSAVLFMREGQVIRQMRYAEFEAILDHIAAIGEFSSSKVTAVYVEIDHSLHISAAVFFLLEFDERGLADTTWSIPLQSLADKAKKGPDLGSGPIRLATRKQCPMRRYQGQLWEPPGEPGALALLRKTVAENRLGLARRDEQSFAPLKGIIKNKAAKVVESTASDGIPVLAEDAELREQAPGASELDSATLTIKTLRCRLSELKGEHAEHIVQLQREYGEDAEQSSRLHDAIKQLKQQILVWREKAAGGEFLQKMSDAGIGFKACQPGAGEFQLPLQDVFDYLKSPSEYAARICCVDVEQYEAWLAHDGKPCCRYPVEGGGVCGLPVHRVDSPVTFVVDESDRCSQHRASSLTLSRVMQK